MIALTLLIGISGSFADLGAQSLESGDYSKSTHIYKTVDGHDILADVYQASADEIRPSILLFHGGALIFGRRDDAYTTGLIGEYLANGYNVVSVDYRLAPESKLPEIIADIEDAYDWIRTEGPELFGADRDRIAVVGHSAGGYLALVAGYRFQPKPRAVVAFYGFGDLTGAWHTTPSSIYTQQYDPVPENIAFDGVEETVVSEAAITSLTEDRWDIYVYAKQKGIWPLLLTTKHPATDPEWFASFEPLRNVSENYPPTMLLHGQADSDVPYEVSPMMAEELARHGIDYELVTDPEWGHGFELRGLQDPTVAAAMAKLLAFLEKNLR
jgi:acetyl esterase/lipase